MSTLPLDFIDTDSFNIIEVLMSSTPLNSHLYRPEHLLPTRMEDFSDLLPTQTSCPPGQEPGVGLCQMVFPGGPRNSLDANTTLTTLNTAHCIYKEDSNAPEWNELESPEAQRVIAWPYLPTPRAPGAGCLLGGRNNFHL